MVTNNPHHATITVFGRVYLHIPADLVYKTATLSPQLHGWLHHLPIG